MKCKHCNGTGTTNWCVNGTFVDCPYCGGTGEMEVEQTEQEYIQTCNTEQLAEVLADVSLWNHPFMKQENRFELLKKQFYEWLKKTHTEKE